MSATPPNVHDLPKTIEFDGRFYVSTGLVTSATDIEIHYHEIGAWNALRREHGLPEVGVES